MESDKKMFFLFLIAMMLFVESTYYPKSFMTPGGVAARNLEVSAAGTTSYNVINGAEGTIYDNVPDNVENGNNTSSKELPPPMSAPAPSAIVPMELPPPMSGSTPPMSVPAPSTIVPVVLPPPTSVSTPSNVIPVYGGRYDYPWWPIQATESASGSAPGEKQKQLQP